MLYANIPVLLVAGVIVGIVALVLRDAHRIAAVTRRVAISLVLGFAVIAVLFISGYAFEDPGGLTAWAMTAAWVLPMVGLALWGWFSPRTAEPVMWAATLVILILSISWAARGEAWQDFMNDYGPVIGIAALAVGVGLAAWGYHRPIRGAICLLMVAIAPVVGAGIAAGFGFATAATSTAVTVCPFLTCALLYLLAWRLDRASQRSDVALVA